jgi:MOSC domain-containing protein YiiM
MGANCTELEAEIQQRSGLLNLSSSRCGFVAALYVGPERKAPMVAVPEVHAIFGSGLEGDRYCRERGTFSKKLPSNHITLIEGEALEAAFRDYGIEITADQLRRNVITCGIALNHMVGREFQVGAVRLRGMKLCEPCTHLQQLTGRQMIKALRHRGGLRAAILSDGTIKLGDRITEEA